MSEAGETIPAGSGRSGAASLQEPPPPAVPGLPAPGPSASARRRVLGLTGDWQRGPRLICLAGLHGNEPAGVRALERVFERLEKSPAALRGGFLGLAGNLGALARGRRYLAEDLNRIWLEPRIARARRAALPQSEEERELKELDAELARALEAPRRQVFLLDLHTTSGPGPAFAVVEDALPNRAFGLELEVPLVLGLEEELSGTLSHYMAAQGVVTVGFEAGQHLDPASVDRAEAAIWIALEASGVLPANGFPASEARRRLRDATRGLPRVVEVRHRHSIAPGDDFQIAPGLESFQRVRAGDVVATNRVGPVQVLEDGLLLMPLYQRQGDDGFFLMRPVRILWLKLSSLMRRLRLERVVHWLPGVRRHPELRETYLVDRRTARWLALDLFHLLGFRRRAEIGRVLVVSRRRHDSL